MKVRSLITGAACALLALSACGSETPEPPRAETLSGPLVGLSLDDHPDGGVFRGVPFATPPVGALRWHAPHPVEAWSVERPAQSFAPACMQTRSIVDWYGDIAEAFGQSRAVAPEPEGVSEDCLYLNVWTPDLSPDEPAPVMVYIHGGSYTGGWSYEPNYHGDASRIRALFWSPSPIVWALSAILLRIQTMRPPMQDCMTRSPRWSGCRRTSAGLAATLTR